MKLFFSSLRARIQAAGYWPQGWVARGACYSLGFAAGLFGLEMLLKLFAPKAAGSIQGWVTFLLIVAASLFSVVAFRWLKRKILWRLRNRLIVTYVFIGVIPAVLLVAMTLITLYGLAGQFAIFVVTSEIESHLRTMEAVNAAVGNELAARLERGDNPTAESLIGLRKRDASWGRRRVSAWHGDKPLPLGDDSKLPPLLLPTFARTSLREIARDQDGLHLRVVSLIPVGSKTLMVVTSEPFDKQLIGQIAPDIGEITLFATEGPRAEQNAGQNVKQDFEQQASIAGNTDNKPGRILIVGKGGVPLYLRQAFTAGTMPSAVSSLDREVTFPAPLPVLDWKTGEREPTGAVVYLRTRPSMLYGRLFAALGEYVRGVEYILLGIFVFFALIELIALIIGTRMTRTVTRAVAQLDDATKHVDRGDFSHRIPVKADDQLAQLSLSFNSMTASIEKLILEQKEKQRLEGELAIAQEVQAQLFPRQVTELESLEVHGFCRPARTVSGDYYDFLTASSHKLILAVGDISGKGISAALLMATIHSAVRAYSVESLPQFREPMMREPMMREPVAVGAVAGASRVKVAWPEGIEVSPGALLSLLNHQLYESTPPEKYATLFLAIYDGRSHRLTYSNGGHLPPILIGRDGAVRRLETGGTVVGLFDNMTYDEAEVEMHPGEIFLAYSDGVTEPENDFGEFGEERLVDLVSSNRRQSLLQISQTVTSAVDDWIGDNEQPDDITLVLARAR